MKKIYLTIAIIIAIFNYLYAQNAEEGTVIEKTIMVEDTERKYLLYIPASYDGSEPWPLVLNFHGFSVDASFQAYVSNMNPIADEGKFLVAYPEGLVVLDPFSNTEGLGWNVGGNLAPDDDVAFTDKLIDQVSLDYLIDAKKIYTTGWSMGSNMAYEVACMLEDKIAAVAGVSNQMEENQFTTCKPIRSISALFMHGTDDPLIPFDGFEPLFSEVAKSVNYWVEANICSGDSETISFEDVDTEDGSTVTLIKYTNCDRSTEVFYYIIEGGGHSWPGGGELPPFVGTLNKDINASEEIWNFFKKFTLPDLEKLPKVDEFVLVDAVKNEELTVLEDGATINLVTLENEKLSVVAKSASNNTESILLELTGPQQQSRVENLAPYALFGDVRSNYRGKKLPTGTYNLKASPFDANAMKGDMGLRKFLTFQVIDEAFIRDFTLVDANTNEDLMTLENGTIINLDETGNSLNIRANVFPEQVGSVEFNLNSKTRIENVKPYAVFGDIFGNYFEGNLNSGTNILEVNAYEESRARGEMIATLTITFEVIGDDANQRKSKLYQNDPNPFGGNTTLRAYISSNVQDAKIAIFDNTGTLMKEIVVNERDDVSIKPNLAFSRKGIYYFRLTTDGKNSDTKKMILK